MSGRHAPRSKNGCLTCKIRKLKCNEQRPQCARCTETGMRCDWDSQSRPPRRHISSSKSRKHQPSDVDKSLRLRPLYMQPSDCSPHELKSPSEKSTADCGVVDPSPTLHSSARLSTSVVLSPINQEFFEYFPHSNAVRTLGKPWPWNLLRYIYEDVATKSSSVFGMILAISASEMHAKRTATQETPEHISYHPSSSSVDMGINYYRRALHDMSSLLGNAQQQKQPLSQDDLHAIFATFYLMITYEHHFQYDSKGGSVHIRGVQSFLESHFKSPEDGQNGASLVDKLPPLCRSLLLFIIYYELTALHTGQSTGQLLQHLDDNQEYRFDIDDLFLGARTTLSEIWGSRYPAEELLDDLENYRPLQLLHECIKFQFKFFKIFKEPKTCDVPDKHDVVSLQHYLESTRKKFQDLFIMANTIVNVSEPRRVMRTIYCSTAIHYGNELFYHRVICRRASSQNCHRTALSSLLTITRQLLELDDDLITRISFPLFLASLETDDAIYQEWIQKSFRHAECCAAISTWFRKSIGKVINETCGP